MKKHLSLCLISLLCVSIAKADQLLSYPKKNPLVTFKVPDDWKPKIKGDSLFVLSPGDDGVIVEVMMMEAAKGDADAAIKEAKATVDEFKHLVFAEPSKGSNNGLDGISLDATGEDSNGKANISLMILSHPKSDNPILVSMIASPEVAAKNAAGIFGIMGSLSAKGVAAGAPAAAAEPAPAAARAAQTYNYPSDDKPDFSLSFPGSWKFDQDAVSAYLLTPDKLVATNILMIDQGEAGVALENLKKQTGQKYTSVEWSDDLVNTDEALGLTATFVHGKAEDAKGLKYSINFAQYVRKEGVKFMMIICQHPLAALRAHGDDIEAMIKSIKVRK